MYSGEEKVKSDSPEGQTGEIAEFAIVFTRPTMSCLPAEYEKNGGKRVNSDKTTPAGEKNTWDKP